MRAWLAVSDVVFSCAGQPQSTLLRRGGATDVRLVPHTYCHIAFSEAERTNPLESGDLTYDAVLIGSGLAHLGRVSRVPGAVARASLVRKFEHLRGFRFAAYGCGWSGPAAKGVLPFAEQARAIREGLMSVNWDHFPRFEGYASNRLAISMISGRVHLTTAHRGLDWVPGEEYGVFLAPSVSALVERARELMASPIEGALALGAAAHDWARGRLSHREAARFMLGAADARFLGGLPEEPWLRLASEWPR